MARAAAKALGVGAGHDSDDDDDEEDMLDRASKLQNNRMARDVLDTLIKPGSSNPLLSSLSKPKAPTSPSKKKEEDEYGDDFDNASVEESIEEESLDNSGSGGFAEGDGDA